MSKWIAKAIKKPGSLRNIGKSMGMIKGDQPFSVNDLSVLSKSKNPKTRKRAVLAKTLRSFNAK